MYGVTGPACLEPLSKFTGSAYEDPLCSNVRAISVWDHLAYGTSITFAAAVWCFSSAIYQTTFESTRLAVCLFRTKYLDSMTSYAPQNGRDRANDPWFGQFVYSRHYFTQSERSHRKLFAIRQAKPETNAVKESGERLQGPDMSRRSRTHPAVTPGVGLTSTRHVRDTVGKCSVDRGNT